MDSELRGPQFLLLNLKEFNLSMGISHINPCDIVVFLENCPFVERIFIDVSMFICAYASFGLRKWKGKKDR